MATKASNIGDLNKLREDGVEIDKKIYSEQRPPKPSIQFAGKFASEFLEQ